MPSILIPYWMQNFIPEGKVGSQVISEVTGKFGLGVQNGAWQRLTKITKRTYWSKQTPSSNNTRKDSSHGHQQMVNTEIRLIIFIAAKDGEALTVSKNKTKS